jgi:hypothetical protein
MLYSSKLGATVVILGDTLPLVNTPAPVNPYPPPPGVPDTLNIATQLIPIAFPDYKQIITPPSC